MQKKNKDIDLLFQKLARTLLSRERNGSDIDKQLAELPSLRMYYMIDDYDELFGHRKASNELTR